jgi:transcriptional regulator with XRE-family HTH domain
MKYFISSNLRYLRIKNNVSQAKMGEICNKKNTTIANWEKGIREPSAIDLMKLCNFFMISIDDFIKKDLRK